MLTRIPELIDGVEDGGAVAEVVSERADLVKTELGKHQHCVRVILRLVFRRVIKRQNYLVSRYPLHGFYYY